ncbi:fungal-specific transcription factor domain-containing protein [Aspergillus pseudoustus]|uniref:Fungal-specific transcription factor domain-containing protein n=1 Tax=Aspergillus pseudoustus TaxID=1810923 RepID=A0ABR4JA41_9EURO
MEPYGAGLPYPGARPVRRRASLACDTCRRQKEKCEGGPPCWRCQRLGRPCTVRGRVLHGPTEVVQDRSAISNKSRVEGLELIVRHFLGDVRLDEDNVSRIVARLGTTPQGEAPNVDEPFDVQFVSKNIAHYSGEFSHWNFSQKLRRKIRSPIERFGVKEYWRPTQLQSGTHMVSQAMSHLPPRPIAMFLVTMFFKYSEGNVFYMEQTWLQERLERCYTQSTEYSLSDVPWVCSVFAVLAIGTQVAHMEDQSAATEDLNLCSEDSVGLSLYHIACRLVPDVILVASHESVQAFLLLALYALPLSTGGLSYSYLGIAVKMAIQNGMHRKYVGEECGQKIIETRNRVFWSAYSLDRRIGIFHGRPASISKSDISTDLPNDDPSFSSPPYVNMIAFIKLSSWLGEIAETLVLLRNCPKRFIPEYLERLMQIRTHVEQWWSSLPCCDTTPGTALFRQNSHLRLAYLLIYIYMGRPFMFTDDWRDADSRAESAEPRVILVRSCVQSALEIIETLQLLASHTGLCRASYTEFSSCRAALLVILAERVNSQVTDRFEEELARGMALIRRMTGGSSSESEISYLESLDAAIRQSSSLATSGADATQSSQEQPSAYAQFKHWTQAMKSETGSGNMAELSSFSPLSFLNSDPGSFGQPRINEVADLMNADWLGSDFQLVPDGDAFAPFQAE